MRQDGRVIPRFLTSVVLGGVVGALALAPPAAAHTGVTVEPAVAGARGAVATFTAEAESKSAGVTSLRVVLPPGLVPADISLVEAPAGWALGMDAEAYLIAGPALPAGQNLRHRVRIRQLPNVPVLVFKVLQTYSDGRTDRWIEEPSAANPNPDNPAPTVRLQAAAPGTVFESASPSAPPSTPSGPAPPVLAPATGEVAPPAEDSGRTLVWLVVTVLLAAAVLVAGGVYIRRRYR